MTIDKFRRILIDETKSERINRNIDKLLQQISYYSICAYFDFFQYIPQECQNIYIDGFIFASENHYIASKYPALHTTYIGKYEFYKGWKNFIHDLQAHSSEIGPKVASLRQLMEENPCDYSTAENFTHKLNRFWHHYVMASPKADKNNNATLSNNSEEILAEELPLYYILYTIYFYSNSITLNIEQKIFREFSDIFYSSRRQSNINAILYWCVSCFHELTDYLKNHSLISLDSNKRISYVSSIPGFLNHFNFYRYAGLEWLKNDFIQLLEQVSCNPQSNALQIIIPDISDFLITHRFFTQPLIDPRNKIFNKPRKGEKQSMMSANTLYIRCKLEQFFLLPRNALDSYFIGNFSDTSKQCNLIQNETNMFTALNIELKEFLSSVFLCISRNCSKNDPLSYINISMYYYSFVYLLTQIRYDKAISDNNIEGCHEEIKEATLSFIAEHSKLNIEDIYQQIVDVYLHEIIDLTDISDDAWDEEIISNYFSFFEKAEGNDNRK